MSEDVRQSVARLARLAARLADPFADRAAALAACGLDEPGWQSMQRHWHAELQRRSASGDQTLVRLYQECFSEERDRMAAARAHVASRGPAARREAGDVVDLASVDATTLATPVLAPALPFLGSNASPPPALAEPSPAEDPDAQPGGADGTMTLDAVAPVRVLPFDDESDS